MRWVVGTCLIIRLCAVWIFALKLDRRRLVRALVGAWQSSIDSTLILICKNMTMYQVLLVVIIVHFTCSNAHLATTQRSQLENPVAPSTETRSSPKFLTDASKKRLLRVEISDLSSYSFQDEAEVNDSEVEKEALNERGAEGILKSLKTIGDKISPALPLKTRLKIWSKNEKPIDFVKKELGLDQLTAVAFTQAANYKLYDDFVTSQLPIWAKTELAPDEVMAKLGLQTLSGEALTTNPNFKYFDEYVNAQLLVWGKRDLSTDDVLKRLGLITLSGAARTDAVNYRYYDAFVVNQLKSWLKSDLPLDDVMLRLKLDKLSGDALLSHPNYKYYKIFVKNKLKSWATDGASPEYVLQRLGLENLQGRSLESHPNYIFFVKFTNTRNEYREEGWLKQKLTTFDVWKKLELSRVRPTKLRTSFVYKIYKSYVNMLDNYIIDLVDSGFSAPKLISKDATTAELHAKTLIWVEAKRPEWYVKSSLGLNKLEGAALTQATNYQFFERYLEGIKHIQ